MMWDFLDSFVCTVEAVSRLDVGLTRAPHADLFQLLFLARLKTF